MNSHLFFFGNNPELAREELSVFFPSITPITPDIVRVDTDLFLWNSQQLPIQDCLTVLAGTTKVADILGKTKNLTPEVVSSYLLDTNVLRIDFGISSYGSPFQIPGQFLPAVKDILKKKGFAVRFLEPRHGETLSAVAVARQHIVEINIVYDGTDYTLAKTIAVQEFEAWNKRDYGRPYADPKGGMLPPKAARMMASIGLGNVPKGKTLLDPFCGMGTIIGEAMLLGAKGIGGDHLPDVIKQAEANCSWLWNEYPSLAKPTFYTADAAHVSEVLPALSVDTIVTEPFMGTSKLGEGRVTETEKIKDIMKGLEKLYRGCLRDWHVVLKPEGNVVMAIPQVTVGKTIYSVKNVIDSCETLGYTLVKGPFLYGRPQAIVKRMIYKFRKQ